MPSTEYTVRDYEFLQVQLQGLQWRTVVLLLGSTFLTFFWFSSFSELIFKFSFAGFLRSLLLLPLIANSCSWALWLALVILPELGFRRGTSLGRDYSSSEEDLRYLERNQILQLRLRRTTYYGRFIQVMIALEFILIGIVTAFILLGRL